VDVFVLEANVDVVLSRRDGHVDVRHDPVFLFFLHDVRLARTVDLHVNVLCASHKAYLHVA